MRNAVPVFLAWLIFLPAVFSPASGQKIKIRGGMLELQVTTASPGQNPPPATDASTTLQIREREDGAFKVAVSTTAPEQQYDLRVEAMDLNEGVPLGEVSLTDGMAPADLIRNIDLCDKRGGGRGRGPPGGGPPGGGPPCREEATLRYRTFVAAEHGSGSDSHTVRYTILAQ